MVIKKDGLGDQVRMDKEASRGLTFEEPLTPSERIIIALECEKWIGSIGTVMVGTLANNEFIVEAGIAWHLTNMIWGVSYFYQPLKELLVNNLRPKSGFFN